MKNIAYPEKKIHGGCGRVIANCGHKGLSGEEPFFASGKCPCGRNFSVSCSLKGCTGRDFSC